MPSDGMFQIIQINHSMGFYDIQMPELFPSPIKKEYLRWLGNRCILKVPQVILTCSQG